MAKNVSFVVSSVFICVDLLCIHSYTDQDPIRLTSSNTADEHDDHCTDCIEIARRARRQSRAVPSKRSDRELPPSSAKTRKIVELLEEILARERKTFDGEEEFPHEKTIVFSQFTSMLDIIQVFLDDAGIKYVRCEYVHVRFAECILTLPSLCVDDGTMSKDERDVVLHKIRTSKSVNVILISFKAGSVGKLSI